MKLSYEDLQAEVEWLRAELGVIEDDRLPRQLRMALGIYPCIIQTLIRLYAANGRFVQLWALRSDVDHVVDPPSTIKSYVSKIRRRLGYDAIETNPGVGYRLTDAGRARIDAELNAERREAA